MALAACGVLVAGSSAASGDPDAATRPELSAPAKARATGEHAQSRVLVKFADGVSAGAAARTLERVGSGHEATVGGTSWTIADAGGDAVALVGRLRSDPRVAAVALDYRRKALDENLPHYPNDSRFGEQRQAFNTVFLPAAWRVNRGSAAVTIAVVDTGVDLDHPDLAAHVLPGRDFANDDFDASDDEGHGTHVAGLAAAITDNGKGVAGAAWDARILPVKVLDGSGAGWDSDIAAGITWAADAGADVINLSLGGPEPSSLLREAVDYASARGSIVVAAAGNDGAETPSYPAAYPNVVAVTATDDAGRFAWFSNYGPWVDIAAPGIELLSTKLAAGPVEAYGRETGTSFSTPLIAGALGLVRAAMPAAPSSEVTARVVELASDRGPGGLDPFYGRGVLDAAAAHLLHPRSIAQWQPSDENDAPSRAISLDGGRLVTAEISPEGESDWFSVDVGAPAFVQFSAVPPEVDERVIRAGELDPVLEVFGPDLERLAEADLDGVGDPESVVADATRAGRYYLRVRNFHGSTSGEYRVVAQFSAARSGRYLPPTTYAAGAPAVSSTIGDVTGDGRADLLATTSGEYDTTSPTAFSLLVYPQREDGWLGTPTAYAPGEAFSWGELATADMDGDGRTDVVAGGVGILYGRDGGLEPPDHVEGLFQAGYQLGVADFDGDGDLDIAANAGDPGNQLLVNQGGRRFERRIVSSELGDHRELDVGDVTGDGRPDIVTSSGKVVKVYPQLVGGTFGPAQQHSPAAAPTYDHLAGLEVADVTADGRADVVAAVEEASPNARLSVFPQRAVGGLGAPVAYPAGDYPEHVEAADENGDGRTDVVVSHWSTGELSVYVQRPDGTLERGSPGGLGPASRYASAALSLGDLTGDGALDIALAAEQEAGVSVLRQRSARWPRAGWVASTSPATHAREVALPIVPQVRFVRRLDPASVNQSTVQLRNAHTLEPVPATAVYDDQAQTISVVPSGSLEADLHHVLTVSNVRGSDGERMDDPLEVRFLTTPMPPDFSDADRTRYPPPSGAQPSRSAKGADVAAAVAGDAADGTPPQTAIANGPGDASGRDPTFVFASDEPDARFVCRLDDDFFGFRGCERQSTFWGLPDGQHVLEVAAVDAAGNRDPTPTVHRWRSNRNTWEPQTRLTAGTWGTTTLRSAVFHFSSDEPGRFECSLDGGEFLDCASPKSYDDLRTGTHSFRVRSINVYGYVDGTPVKRWWTVEDEPPPPPAGDPAPDTRIDEAPPSETGDPIATFRFSSTDAGSTFQCAVDGEPYAPCSSPFTFLVGRHGTHVFQVRAFDPAGSVDRTPAEWVWHIDMHAPETTITSGPPHDTRERSATFAFRSSEEPATFVCSVDNQAFEPCSSPHTVEGLPDGLHTFAVRARDRFVNLDPTEDRRWWVVDNEPPESRIRKAPPSPTHDTTATIEFDAEWPGTIECSLDDGPYAECSSPVTYRGLSRGDHVVRVRVTDRAGNVDPTPAEARWTITEPPPRTPPETTITNAPKNPSASREVYFYFSSSESGSRFECSVDGRAFTTCWSPQWVGALADGSHSFTVRAIDPDGDVDASPDRYDWVVDTARPDTQIDSGPPAVSRSGSAIFQFSSNEPDAEFRCALDGSLTQPCSSPWTIEGLADGQHWVDVIAVDRAGNHDGDSAATRTWRVDTSSPETTIVEAPPESTPEPTASFRFAADETTSAFECSLDGASYERCAAATSYANLGTQLHTLAVRAVDEAGNADPSPDRHAWTVADRGADATAPEMNPTITSSHTASWSNDSTVDVAWSGASDSGSGVDGFSFEWSQSASTAPDTVKDVEENVGAAASPVLADGSWWFHLRTGDNAGNWSGPVHLGPFRIDTNAPTSPVVTTTHPSTWTADGTVQIAWSGASDTHSGVDGFSYAWTRSASDTPDTTKEAEETATSATSPPLADGQWWFHLRARDNAGNWSGTARVGPFLIDAAAPTNPTVSSPSHQAGTWSNDSTVESSWSGSSDAHSGVDGFSYSWTQGAADSPDDTKEGEQGAASATSPTLTDGDWWFHLRSRDNAGNWSAPVHLGPFRIDTVAPSNPVLSSTSHTVGGHSNDPTVVVGWTGGRADAYSYAWSEVAVEEIDTTQEADGSAGSARSDPLADGSWWFHLRTSQNGVWSHEAHLGPFLIDTRRPVTTITTGPAGSSAASSATFEFAADEPAALECALDGAPFSACSSPLRYESLAPGDHVFRVRAHDRAGNTEAAPAERTWTIVSAPPPPPQPPSPPQPPPPAPPPPTAEPPAKRPPVGAKPCVVPQLRGRTLPAATAMIRRAGCRVGRVKAVYSTLVERGRVISQTPSGRRRMARGSRVGIVLSRGRKPATRRR